MRIIFKTAVASAFILSAAGMAPAFAQTTAPNASNAPSESGNAGGTTIQKMPGNEGAGDSQGGSAAGSGAAGAAGTGGGSGTGGAGTGGGSGTGGGAGGSGGGSGG